MLSKYKPQIERRFLGLAKSLSWINPNVLTIIGIIPQVLFFIFMHSHSFTWAAFMLVLSVFDMLDGMVARLSGKVSRFGAFLDSTVDRISDFIIIAGFYASGLIPLELAAVLLAVTYLISYARSRAELASGGEIKFDRGLIERPERIIYMFAVLILHLSLPDTQIYGIALPEFLMLILTVLSVYTLLQRIWYAYKNL
ncbi:MAG TPA: CDP-alcohol phosphatidyltransferase family protein [Patescibacteria group bacterium]|jgi:archaetidylinositol phosphate synthase|nr:CDP-alcohol phosphatidyltransferase family protein [Patescibacteria group bacterium]